MKRREIVLLVLCILQAFLIVKQVTYLSIKGDADRALINRDYAKAIKLYKLAQHISINNVPLYYSLAHAYKGLGDKTRALDAAYKAVKKYPRNSEYFAYYGGLLAEKDQYAEAEKQYIEAIKWGPYDPQVYTYLAYNQLRSGKSATVINENCAKALDYDGYTKTLLLTIIENNINEGKINDAAAMCQVLSQYIPNEEGLKYLQELLDKKAKNKL